MLIFSSLQNPSFSFNSCLPSGWIFLLLSGVLTLISERLFLDQQKFWSTFSLHFSIGLACFLVSLCIMWVIFFEPLTWSFFCFSSLVPLYKFYFCFFFLNSYRRERSFFNKIVRFRQHSDWHAFSGKLNVILDII